MKEWKDTYAQPLPVVEDWEALDLSQAARTFAREAVADLPTSGPGLFWTLVLMVDREMSGHVSHPLEALETQWARLWAGAPSLLSLLEKDPGLPSYFADQSTDGGGKPGIWHSAENTLYFEKSYIFERSLVEDLASRLAQQSQAPIKINPQDFTLLPGWSDLHALQQTAVIQSLGSPLFVLSGGPGTGKTTTLKAILQAHLTLGGVEPQGIAVIAPKGRAARRMGESLGGDITPQTVHNLLGIREFEHQSVRYHKNHPLPYSLVVVDEASMLDLRIFGLLLAALSPSTTLILVGDKDQLPSVDNGAVLGDILEALVQIPRGETYYTVLTHCYRAMGELMTIPREIVGFRVDQAGHLEKDALTLTPLQILGSISRGPKSEGLVYRERENLFEIKRILKDESTTLGFQTLLTLGRSPAKSWKGDVLRQALTQGIVLTATRKGLWGVEGINAQFPLIFRQTVPFPGMPLLVTRNDKTLEIANGDRGLVVEAEGSLKVVFPDPEGSGIRVVPLGLLRGWEPGWALTIHKSQGSEFDHVLLVLSLEKSDTLHREILYTGMTRARKLCVLLGDKKLYTEVLGRKGQRDSSIPRLLVERLRLSVG